MKKLFLVILLFYTVRLAGQTSYFITSSDGTRLSVKEFGQGQLLILLAGGPGLDAIYLKAVWEQLQNQYRCIVLDQRGTGQSETGKIDSATATVDTYVNDVEALRQHLKLEQLTLIGHSWGGMLSMAYASKHPNRVKKMILIGSGGPTGKFFSYFSDNLRMRLHEEDLKEMAELEGMKKSTLKGYWAGYFYHRDKAIEAKKATNFEELLDNSAVSPFLVASYFATERARIAGLKEFKGPVCIIQGRQDPIGESTVFEIRELLPQSQIHFIEKCGHLPWLETKEQVGKLFELLNKCLQ